MMSKNFEANDYVNGKLYHDLVGDVLDRGYYAVATHRTTGVVVDTRSRGRFKTYREAVEFCSGAFKGFHLVKVNAAEAEAADRAMLQKLLDSGEPLSASQRTSIFKLGLTKTEEAVTAAAPTTVNRAEIDENDWSVAQVWSTLKPQAEFFDPKLSPERQRINTDAVRAILTAHSEWRPVTHDILNQKVWPTLSAMYCIQTNPVVHKRRGAVEGGRAYDYSKANDPTIRVAPRRFTASELAAFNKRLVSSGLPQGTTIALGSQAYQYAVRVVGQEAVNQLLGDFSGYVPEVTPAVPKAAKPPKLTFTERSILSQRLIAGGLGFGTNIARGNAAYDKAVEIIGQAAVDQLLEG
jgi:hypothetical protein